MIVKSSGVKIATTL